MLYIIGNSTGRTVNCMGIMLSFMLGLLLTRIVVV